MIVVGGGPAGLTTALALRHLGLPATVLERGTPDRVRPGSRALFVHGDTLRLLRQLDPQLVDDVTAHGVQWRVRRTLHRGRLVYEGALAPSPPGELPPFVSLRQTRTEELLLAACRRAGVDLVHGVEVTTVVAGADSVSVTGSDGRSWTAPYVIGADGAGSAVRRSLGVGMDGSSAEGFHVVVDLAEDPGAPLPPVRTFHYEHPALAGRSVLEIPFAGGRQVDLQCRATDLEDDFATPEAVLRWLPAVMPTADVTVLWVSSYTFHQVVATSMVDPTGRVLLVGEAAHLFPPFGARGMNSGMFDAVAAARAVAGDEVADFASIRGEAALQNRDAAAAALRHLRPDRLTRHRQRLAALLAPRVRRAGRWLEHAPYGPATTMPTRY